MAGRTYSWTGVAGQFSDPANWLVGGVSDGTVPASTDTADIGGGLVSGTGTVDALYFLGTETLAGAIAALSNTFQSSGVLTLSPSGSIATAHFYQTSDTSDLEMQPGAVLTVTGTINNPGPNAYLDGLYVADALTANGASILSGGQINIGSATASSSVVALDGATLRFWAANVGDAPAEAASLLVTGAGTTWSNVGGAVPGNPNNSGGYLLIGAGYPSGTGTSGSVTISAGALLANAQDVTIGAGAGDAGRLAILGGGHLTSAGGTDQVGEAAGSSGSAVVDGAGSTWKAQGQIAVAPAGAGSLLVSNGGAVAAARLSLGSGQGAAGVATVAGAGSSISLTAGLAVAATGSLTLSNGGLVSASGGADVFAAGSVSLSGGALQTDALTIAAGGSVAGSGTLAGAITDDGTIAASGGTLEIAGTVSGPGVLTIAPGATLRLDGAVAPGTTIEFASNGTGTLEEANAAAVQAVVIGQQAGDVIGLPPGVDTVSAGGGAPIPVDFGSAALGVLAAPLLAGTSPASTLFITTPGSYAMTAAQTAAVDTASGGVTLAGNGLANETIAAGPGAFAFQGGAGGSGTVVAGSGADSIYLPGGGNWATFLGNGADTVVAATGNDTVSTGTGGSFVFLGAGASSVVSAGADTILGATGAATVSALGANSDELFALGGPLAFIAGTGASTVVSGTAAATLFGGAAGGTLMFGDGPLQYGGAGATDTVVGLAGSITAQGGAGGGQYFGGTAGGNVITAGAGNVTAFGGGAGDVLTATGSASDLFAGGVGAETLSGAGSTGNNTFFAGFGPETLAGGAGNTALVAGAGADLLAGGSGLTLFLFVAGRTAGASDTITGFDPSHDFVKLAGYAGDEAGVVAGATQVGGSSVIALSDGTQITFAGLASLNPASFT